MNLLTVGDLLLLHIKALKAHGGGEGFVGQGFSELETIVEPISCFWS